MCSGAWAGLHHFLLPWHRGPGVWMQSLLQISLWAQILAPRPGAGLELASAVRPTTLADSIQCLRQCSCSSYHVAKVLPASSVRLARWWQALMERGVLVVPLPIFERSSSAVLSSMDEVPSDDLRYASVSPPALAKRSWEWLEASPARDCQRTDVLKRLTRAGILCWAAGPSGQDPSFSSGHNRRTQCLLSKFGAG